MLISNPESHDPSVSTCRVFMFPSMSVHGQFCPGGSTGTWSLSSQQSEETIHILTYLFFTKTKQSMWLISMS